MNIGVSAGLQTQWQQVSVQRPWPCLCLLRFGKYGNHLLELLLQYTAADKEAPVTVTATSGAHIEVGGQVMQTHTKNPCVDMICTCRLVS